MANITAKELKRLRKSLEMTLADAQKKSGVDQAVISSVENLKRHTSPEAIFRLAKAYKVEFPVAFVLRHIADKTKNAGLKKAILKDVALFYE